MISQKIRENLKENPFQIGAKHINSNKTLSKELKEEMDFETLEEITERVGRSQSHFVFQFRPEHVPKPKPKKTFVQPTPMILCLNSIQESENPLFYLKQAGDPYFSCPDSDDESEFSTEETEIAQSEYTISNKRREMNRIRSKTLVNDNNRAKDCDDIEGKEKKSFDKVIRESETTNRLSNLFSSSIRTIIKKEKEECKRMTIGPTTRQSGLSLLKILEVSANRVNKKIDNCENVKYDCLSHSLRLKRSSTIV